MTTHSQHFKVSILLSVFNAEKTIDKTFESLLAQTSQDFSIVVINDSSQDDTQTHLERWKSTFGEERFVLLQNEKNLGLTRSLNRGLGSITTPYTARIDADDWWHPMKLERQISFLEKNPDYGLVGCHYINVFGQSERIVCPPETDRVIKQQIFGYNPFAHSTVIFRTTLVQTAGGYDESIYFGQDYDLWLKLLPKTKFYNIPEILCYRTGDAGISRDRQNDQIRQYMRTQWKYLRLYHYPLWSYFFLVRPVLVLASPEWLKRLKRRFFL